MIFVKREEGSAQMRQFNLTTLPILMFYLANVKFTVE